MMTTIGGVGHTLPYLIPDFWTATVLAIAVVVVELAVISWIRYATWTRPFLSAAFQVMVGGALVFARRHLDRQLLKVRATAGRQQSRLRCNNGHIAGGNVTLALFAQTRNSHD